MLEEKFDPTINFDLKTNFDFFWPNKLGFLHGMSVKFGLWTFHKLKKGRKILTLLTFGCPNYDKTIVLWRINMTVKQWRKKLGCHNHDHVLLTFFWSFVQGRLKTFRHLSVSRHFCMTEKGVMTELIINDNVFRSFQEKFGRRPKNLQKNYF